MLIERTFVCPDLDSQASAMAIKEALASTPGVDDVEVSLPMQTVKVLLRNPDGEATVRRHLSSAGFPAED